MSEAIIKIINAETSEVTERQMTAQELAQWNQIKVEAQAKTEAETKKKIQRQALLDRLGITEEEAKLLLS